MITKNMYFHFDEFHRSKSFIFKISVEEIISEKKSYCIYPRDNLSLEAVVVKNDFKARSKLR